MPGARSEREIRAWRLVAVYLGLLYLSLWPLQFALDALRAHNLLRLSLYTLFAVCAAAVVLPVLRRGAGGREWITLVAVAAVYLLVASRMAILQERLHLAEYGMLALLFRRALGARPEADAGRVSTAIAALAWTTAAGLVDELIQGVLPNRQYDLRDVGFNALAGALALASAAILDAARAADARAGGGAGWTNG